jgi:UDP-N-acetylmuramyl pentapeptide phosphotransferase/UDP-N-acetylglucosamine-1-phosphate transferase
LRVAAAVLIVVLILAGAGFWDDLRGDERPRGFKGHLGALGDGRMTGGIVKMVAGGLAGMAAGVLVADTLVELVQVAGMVALSANLINLFDRAPGRAGKVGILFGAVGAGIAQGPVLPMAAPFLGASLAVLPLDLKEEAMLGDQGANPLGGLGGLVWALAVGEEARWLALAVLLFLNLASERWSFSQVIESAPALRRIDGWGRRDD